MNKLVAIDTSVVIATITSEVQRSFLTRMTQGAELIASISLAAEVGNAFSAMFRRGRISLEASLTALRAYERIPIRVLPLDLEHALELSDELGIYAYDAYVISCALKSRASLLTLDGGQREAARRVGTKILEISA